MKTFNPFYIIVLFLSIGFMACEDNFELTEEEISYSEPIEVKATLVTGRILNSNNEAIIDAEVQVVHKDSFLTVITDEKGYYFIELPRDSSRILLQVHADKYLTSGINALTLDQNNKQNDIKLLQGEELDYNGNINLMTTSSNATFFGQILFSDGTPAPDINILLLDLANFTFSSYDITDENGNYLIASEPFENYTLVAARNCEGAELLQQTFSLDSVDVDLGSYTSKFVEISQFSLGGQVVDCNTGEGLASGTISVTFEENSDFYSTDIINGEYELVIDNCSGSTCFDISISSPLYVDNHEIECEPITSGAMESNYTFCEEEIVYDGEIILLIDMDSLILTNATAMKDETTGYWSIAGISEDLKDGFIAVTKADGVGVFDIQVLQVSENGEGVVQQFEGSGYPFVFEITEIDEYIRGSFEGQALRNDGSIIPLSGSFDIKL